MIRSTLFLCGLLCTTNALGSVYRIKVVAKPQIFIANQCSEEFILQSQNSAGRKEAVNSDTFVKFNLSSPHLKIYRDPYCTSRVAHVKIPAGMDSASFYTKSTRHGSVLLYASSKDLVDDSRSLRVMADPKSPSALPPLTPPSYGRTIPSPMYGLTLDRVNKYKAMATSLTQLPKTMTMRMVFDAGTTPSDYSPALNTFHANSYLMGLIEDSSDMRLRSATTLENKAIRFFSQLKNTVDVWEVGNELNGNWLGTGVENKVRAMFNAIDSRGGKTALTFFWFGQATDPNNCLPGTRYEMFTWISKFLQLDLPPEQRNPDNEKLRLNLDYALVSWYPDQCNNMKPDWPPIFARLQEIFPNAKVGFGELGTENPQRGSAYEVNLINEYYPLARYTPMPSRFIGGYFWWYYAEEYNIPAIKNALINALSIAP